MISFGNNVLVSIVPACHFCLIVSIQFTVSFLLLQVHAQITCGLCRVCVYTYYRYLTATGWWHCCRWLVCVCSSFVFHTVLRIPLLIVAGGTVLVRSFISISTVVLFLYLVMLLLLFGVLLYPTAVMSCHITLCHAMCQAMSTTIRTVIAV